MTKQAKTILEKFEELGLGEKQDVASEIIRRTAHFDFPPLTDGDLTAIADDLFLELDHDEQES